MASRLPRVTAPQLLRALRRAGWYPDHQTGAHLFLRHEGRPGTVVLPMHARRIIKPKTLQSVLDQAGLTGDELIILL
jgi:predicted RNA binding protein YcfA (HicA-like mRNA interferase family)